MVWEEIQLGQDMHQASLALGVDPQVNVSYELFLEHLDQFGD
jgi:hypothetical protein